MHLVDEDLVPLDLDLLVFLDARGDAACEACTLLALLLDVHLVDFDVSCDLFLRPRLAEVLHSLSITLAAAFAEERESSDSRGIVGVATLRKTLS